MSEKEKECNKGGRRSNGTRRKIEERNPVRIRKNVIREKEEGMQERPKEEECYKVGRRRNETRE
jgi:hypothetical protein